MSYSISYKGLDAKQAKYRSVSSVLLVLGLCGLLVEGSVLPATIASTAAIIMLLSSYGKRLHSCNSCSQKNRHITSIITFPLSEYGLNAVLNDYLFVQGKEGQ
jgi:hypothetical protein